MSFGTGPFGKTLDVAAQVVNGICPTCKQEGIFVSVTSTFFRCITCGSDIEQKVNGKISYIKAFPISSDTKIELNGHKS